MFSSVVESMIRITEESMDILLAPPPQAPTECLHVEVANGPRVPARWGTFPTQVCTQCGMWRTNAHRYGPWRKPPIHDAKADDEL